jgi:small subunit ribosomal protein S9
MPRKPSKKLKTIKTDLPAKEKIASEEYIYAVGRRKEATAVVKFFKTLGEISINGKNLSDYFKIPKLQDIVLSPFSELNISPQKIIAKVKGGGINGQAEALRLAISRALVKLNPEYRSRLKTAGFLRRDPRVKERRKYGLKKARRAPQWQKR